MNRERTFLLGLGNQKCGTTWLWEYLNTSDNFDKGFDKEYHIWDAIDIPTRKRGMAKPWRRFVGRRSSRLRYKMRFTNDFYFDYFSSLYSEKIKVAADITPSYSGLGTERLHFINDNFAARDVQCKAVILIRNPINRIKSAVRYNLDRGNYKEGIRPGEKDFFRALEQYYVSDHCQFRTNYHVVIERALNVFGAENVYVAVYENMFSQTKIECLPQFCGVTPDADFGNIMVNKTRSKVQNNNMLDGRIKEFYSDVYDYCFERFPETKELWT